MSATKSTNEPAETEETSVPKSNSVFMGYFDDEMPLLKSNMEKVRSAPVEKKDSFKVFCEGPNQGEYGPVESKLVFTGNMITGGFKVTAGGFDYFKIEWQDTMWFEFNDAELKVRLNEKKQRYVKFVDEDQYEQFKEIHAEIAPTENPFQGFTSDFVARQTMAVSKPPKLTKEQEEQALLQQQTFMHFEVWKEKHNFFKGSNWQKHYMSLEL